jgi:transcriptional regulator with XRE-family HTH domain
VGVSDSFGRRLRLERERRKIPLTSIADNTKISVTLLAGLERDDLSRWPAGIFRRSFLRTYAEALGLEAETLLQEFLTVFPDPHEPRPDTKRIDAPRPIGQSPLRLTLEDRWSPFSGGLGLLRARKRWAAAAWDVALLIGVATSAFVLLDRFWLPFGVSSLFYYVGGILTLGNTPGVCLFGPASQEATVTPSASPSQRNDLEELTNERDPLRLVRRA